MAGDTRVGLGERLEDAIQRLLGDADAGVAHTDAHTLGGGFHANVDPPQAGELQRVGQQVADDLANPRRVAGNLGGQGGVDQAGQLHAGRGVLREEAGGVFHQDAQVERDLFQDQLPGLELGEVEHVVEQFHQHLAGVVGDRQLLALFRGERAVEAQREHAEQAVQRRADLVAHVGQEAGAGLGHIESGLAGFFEFLVG